ncbi:S8 family serine peptidase [Massilia sp. RP-1-19]|uniref:S8 family serine peptidase n=1 Tax=Massilia polaris TaxID=2728846 RepID=A0A848HH52_9BURK|nr:S8 family serine peptidase [Massilia polaris]NML59499.1 S8 family serine peptidase [Massilia polaris]
MKRKITALPVRTLAMLCSVAVLGMAASAASAAPPVRYIVGFKAGADNDASAAVIRARGNVKRKIRGMNAMSVELPGEQVDTLRADKNVAYVEIDPPRYLPSMEMSAEYTSATERSSAANPASGKNYYLGQLVPYGISMTQADQLPNGGAKSGNRKICIIDSGYDRSHEDLNNNGTVTGEYDPGTGWWHTDENSHGTHVAGTIAAANNSGIGVVGVIPNQQLKLHIVKVFGADGWAYSSELADAANKCGDAKANIISMSLSGPEPSATEQAAFDALAAKGILSVAASSNAGTTAPRWPAGYQSVVSVGALDSNKSWATFSNYNPKVELSAPGVRVLSTVPMGTALVSSLNVGASSYAVGSVTGSPHATVTAPMADFGFGGAINPAMAGKVCLISRGAGLPFGVKVANCEASGGVGAILYNNVAGSLNPTLGTTVTTIPSVAASLAEGAAMLGQLGQDATVSVKVGNYAYFDGTSMATPHVAAVAGLVWSYFPSCTAAQIRNTLAKSAEDLGTAGRDDKYGYGLVRAKAAYDRIATMGCNN